jgi:hypothetical protein
MINTVEIIDLKTTEIIPGMVYNVEGVVRANITLPSPDCFIMGSPIAKVFKADGTQVGSDLNMTREGTTDWYRAEFSSTGQLVPGDVIYAEVSANWLCPGSDADNSPGTAVPAATGTFKETSRKKAAKRKSAKRQTAKKKAAKKSRK